MARWGAGNGIQYINYSSNCLFLFSFMLFTFPICCTMIHISAFWTLITLTCLPSFSYSSHATSRLLVVYFHWPQRCHQEGDAPLRQFRHLALCSGVEKNSCSTCLPRICGKGVLASVLGSGLRGWCIGASACSWAQPSWAWSVNWWMDGAVVVVRGQAGTQMQKGRNIPFWEGVQNTLRTSCNAEDKVELYLKWYIRMRV